MSPFTTDMPMSPTLDISFGSQADKIKDFSSVDLSFLPDDLDRNSKEDNGDNMLREEHGAQLEMPENGLFLDSGSPSRPRDGNAAQPSSDSLGGFFPVTPMTPMTPTSESSGIVPQLQNIVATVNLACKLDLKNIALHARNAEYNPKVRGKKTGNSDNYSLWGMIWSRHGQTWALQMFWTSTPTIPNSR
uniref:Uncharacterized protein n=1 Tax=Anolis carolinensis TaxID=28377 RepID=A0A803SYW8_ANOCA